MAEPWSRVALGRTGMQVSPLGLAGSFRIGADDVERAFFELGVNYFFCTKRMKGLCEGLRRLIRAGHRDQLVIASGASIPFGFSVGREWAAQAKALGVDRFDVWQLFWVQGRFFVGGRTWPAMQRIKAEGRARALAISTHDRELGAALARELKLDALMIRYNAAHRGAEAEIFAPLGEDRPAIISYTATRWGRLLKPAGELGPMSAPECYRFVLDHPSVDVALCGAATFDELRADVEGVNAGPLEPERLAEVRRFGDAVRATATGRVGFWGI